MAESVDWMRKALAFAERGRGLVEPNPLVGAVVVRDGVLVGAGHHAIFGGPHAEVAALDAAGDASQGSDLYVTLEPCCHRGKTPPCTDRVIAAGIRRVFAAMGDPFPQVAGGGFEKLRRAGIEVRAGILEHEARRLNAPYLKLLATGRPYVHAKWAMSLDGKIATSTGDSKWITGDQARAHAHKFRGVMDAIVVGIGTVLADDPALTPRPPGPRTPLRVVVDSHARTPIDSQLVLTSRQTPTLIAVGTHANEIAVELLANAGCECLQLPTTPRGRVDITSLLDALGKRRCTNVLVEGGGELLGSFFDLSLVDAVRVYLAAKIVGGVHAKQPVAGLGIDRIADCIELSHWSTDVLGADAFFYGSIAVNPQES